MVTRKGGHFLFYATLSSDYIQEREEKVMKIEKDERVFEAPFAKEKHVLSLDEIGKIREAYRMLGKRVTLTQGVWDLLHRGHIRYLFAAAQMGDVLIVGLDSDALTRQRKGEGRPAVPEEERIEMLSFLPFVNHIVLRDVDQEIGDLIKVVRPDVLIVSGTTSDFPEENVARYEELCGRIVLLSQQARTSSTERLRQQAILGKRELMARLEEFVQKVKEEL